MWLRSQGACNGPEPVPEDFSPDGLEELPEFEVPEQLPLPTWETPPPPKVRPGLLAQAQARGLNAAMDNKLAAHCEHAGA